MLTSWILFHSFDSFIHLISFVLFIYTLGIDVISMLLQSYWIGTDVIVQVFCLYGTDVIVTKHFWPLLHRCYNFQFWGGKQNFVPNMWQVVFSHIPIEGRIIDSNVNGLLDGSGNAMSPLPMILKLSTDVLWPVVLSWSKIGDGAFKCSFYISSKVLADFPMYSSSHSVLPHLYQYIMLLCFLISSLSFGNISKLFKVFPPLKYAWTSYLLQMDL